MESKAHIKYRYISESLEDIAECAAGNLILVGGTALGLFYLNHRVSVDVDFIPIQGDDTKLKEALKGCLSKKGYETLRTRYSNQFVIQFKDTSVKIELFIPEKKPEKIEMREVGIEKLPVASIQDILEMKIDTYKRRKKGRDIYDIIAILDKTGGNIGIAVDLIKEYGKPDEIEMVKAMETDKHYYKLFEEVLARATKADNNL